MMFWLSDPQVVSDAAGQGVTITGSKTFNNWNWPNAVIFAATVITTIGKCFLSSVWKRSLFFSSSCFCHFFPKHTRRNENSLCYDGLCYRLRSAVSVCESTVSMTQVNKLNSDYFFCFEGYGNIAPKTSAGRVFCIFYGLFGVPLCLTWISELGKFFGGRAKHLGQYLTKKGFTLVGYYGPSFD